MLDFLRWLFRPYVWVLVFYVSDGDEVSLNIAGTYRSEVSARNAFVLYMDYLATNADEWEISREDAIKAMQVQIGNTEICVYRQKLE